MTPTPTGSSNIEESFPLDWMYPHLSPHGLIFTLNREPLSALSDEAVKKDRAFWIRRISAGLRALPLQPRAIFRYVNLLVSADRIEEAFRVAGTAQFLDPNNSQLESLVLELSRLKKTRTSERER